VPFLVNSKWLIVNSKTRVNRYEIGLSV
jgi:hypothetical protein